MLVTGIVFLVYFSWITYKEYSAKGCCKKIKSKRCNLFFLGLLNGFLPCGWLFLIFILLSKIQIYPLYLLYIIIFWIGTVPVFHIISFKSMVKRYIPIFRYQSITVIFYFVLAFYSFTLHFNSMTLNSEFESSPMQFFCND